MSKRSEDNNNNMDFVTMLFSGSSSQSGDDIDFVTMLTDLTRYSEDVETINYELKELENSYQRLQASHEESRTVDKTESIKDLQARMEADITLALRNAGFIKICLVSIDRAKKTNHNIPGCGHDLKKKLIESMENFNKLRQEIASEYKETVEDLISTGESESETFMQEQERHSAVKDIERSLQELHQVFLDISVLVQVRGEHLDDMASQVASA